MTLWLDRIFTAGLLFLIVATPFAFGTVQAWAYTAMEVVIFALVIVWMLKRAILAREHGAWSTEQGAGKIRNSKSEIRNCALPLALFLILCAMQLVPLPPSLLKIISPQTFEVYKQSLPGWPERLPYQDLPPEVRDQRSEVSESSGSGSEVSGQTSEVGDSNSDTKSEIRNPKFEISAPSSMLPAPGSLLPPTWLPLSISTGLTKIDLLKFAAFAALFFLVWRYPFEEPFENFEFQSSDVGFFVLSPEQRFLRSVVFAVLGTGLLVAAFGFVERFAWNGNILLFVAGYDAGTPAANTVARASGPFVNPDHFANYLALILPLTLGGALFRTFMVPKAGEDGLKIFCAFTTFLLFTGILLSLSRGAWISALLGISILVWLSPWGGVRQRARSRERGRSQRSAQSSKLQAPSSQLQASRSTLHAPSSKLARMARLSLVTVCILLIVSLFVAGQAGREQVDLRVGETFEQTDLGLGARVSVILKDIPKMIMDFPLFGVGLGAWPELFLRYRSGPWSTVFFREAHNDYLEVLAETGFVGFGLLAVFFFVAGKRLFQGLRKSSSKYLPLIAAILAGLGGMAVHEWLDFSLQIPANAFLFTVLLAIGLRLARSKEQGAGSAEHGLESIPPWESGDQPSAISAQWSEIRDQRSEVGGRRSAVLSGSLLPALRSLRAGAPYAGVAAAALMIVFAVTQDQSSYPQNFKEMTSLAEAKELLLKHPTHSPYHMSVLRLAGVDAPLEWQLTQAKAALWNEPVNPYYRDFYAATLIAMGRTEEGLKEVTRSVVESPSLSTHAYLSPENLPALNEDEQAAVEEGFKQALSRAYPEAVTALAEFYLKHERFADQAALYEQAALKEKNNANKAELLIKGGLAYLRAARATVEVRDQKSEVSGQPSPVVGQRSKELSAKSREQGAASREPDANVRNSGSKLQARGSLLSESGSELQAPGSMLHASAVRLFRAAAAINPADPKPYQQLVAVAFAAESDLSAARNVIDEAIQDGAPPLPLYLSLAEAAHKGGNPDESRAALKLAKAEVDKQIKNGDISHALYMSLADGARAAGDRETETAAVAAALERQPRSPEILSRLAGLYLEKQNYSRASLYLNRIASINANSAHVYYQIAQAEEGQYRFAAADQAYARAVQLAPQNDNYRQRYEAFRERVAANAPERDPKIANSKSP